MGESFDYLEKRIDIQREWHSNKAALNKNKYYAIEIIVLISGALIPVINVASVIPNNLVRLLSALLAAIGVLSAGIGKLYKFHETWLNYRAVAEALKREKEFFINKVGDYNSEQPEKKLVERIESILSSVTEKFVLIHEARREESRI